MITEQATSANGNPPVDLAAAREHLRLMRWSYRRAAEVLGCHSGHLTMVLTGRRASAALLARVMGMGPAPQVPRTSTYAKRKVAKRGDW